MSTQLLVNALSNGAVYGLIALGLVLIYKGTNVVHFGYGDQVMFGAYSVLIVEQFFGLAFSISVVVAILGSVAFGATIYGAVMSPLSRSSPFARLAATIAIGSVLREGVRAFVGPGSWPFPFLVDPAPFRIGGVVIVPAIVAILFVASGVAFASVKFFTGTLSGKALLAMCQDRIGAALVGIPLRALELSVWVVASILATIAGILIAPVLTLTPDMGVIAIKSFAAAVVGGFNNLIGAIVAGFAIAIIETLSAVYGPSGLKDMIGYAVLIVVIVARPSLMRTMSQRV